MKKAKVLFILSMLIVGSIGLFVRSIPFTSPQIALVRGVVGSIFVFVFGFVSHQEILWKRIKANLLVLIVSGIALGVNWILLFQAYKYTTISTAMICYYFAPVLVILLSPLILKEFLNTVKVFCILFALGGMSFIVGVGGHSAGSNDFLGIIYGLGAAVFYTMVIILNKFLNNISGIERSFTQLAVSAVSLLPYVLLSGGIQLSDVTTISIILLIVVGVIHTGVVYLLYFSSMQDLSSQTVAALSYIDPVAAILMSSIFLHEKMTFLQMFGGILILGATFVNEIYGTKGSTDKLEING
ncbi:MAG TPA: DMT family transporter [Desulfosporosinus sp.]|nr:DMT family transporter [Desulfosporosinus sp.]